MIKAYRVSFQYSERTYCTNIATSNTLAAVEKAYSIYPWFSVREATPDDISEAQRKQMPIIQVDNI